MCSCGHEHEVKEETILDDPTRKVFYVDVGKMKKKDIERLLLNTRDKQQGLPEGTSWKKRQFENRIWWSGFSLIVMLIVGTLILSALN